MLRARTIVSDFPAIWIWTHRIIRLRRASRCLVSKNFTKSGFHRCILHYFCIICMLVSLLRAIQTPIYDPAIRLVIWLDFDVTLNRRFVHFLYR